MSLLDQFNDQYKTSGAGKSGGAGDHLFATFDLCDKRNRGMIIGRMVKDSKGSFFRLITGQTTLRVNLKAPDGKDYYETITWMDIDNYKRANITLTEEQIQLHKKLWDIMGTYLTLNSAYYKTEHKETIITYMVATQTNGPDGKKTTYSGTRRSLISHRSKAFLKTMMDSITRVVNMYNGEYIEKFFSRDLGETVNQTVITTSLKEKGTGFGYNVAVEFKSDLPSKATINQDVLDRTMDLKDEVMTVNRFDDDYYRKAIATIEKSIALHANAPKLQDHTEQPVKPS